MSTADADPTAPGDAPTALSGIAAHVVVSSSDYLDFAARDAFGTPFAEPPIDVLVGAIVEINGAAAEGRVAGLRVFVDGTELQETGSAGLPQRFSFQHCVERAMHGQRLDLEFRYRALELVYSLATPLIELTRPAAGESMAADEPFTLEWSGTGRAPQNVSISSRGPACAVRFTQVGGTTFIPKRVDTDTGRPCRFELSVEWQVEIPEPDYPFRSLTLEGSIRRIRRFTVR